MTSELDTITNYILAALPFFQISFVEPEYRLESAWTGCLYINVKYCSISTRYIEWKIGKKRMARILDAIAKVQAEQAGEEQANK